MPGRSAAQAIRGRHAATARRQRRSGTVPSTRAMIEAASARGAGREARRARCSPRTSSGISMAAGSDRRGGRSLIGLPWPSRARAPAGPRTAATSPSRPGSRGGRRCRPPAARRDGEGRGGRARRRTGARTPGRTHRLKRRRRPAVDRRSDGCATSPSRPSTPTELWTLISRTPRRLRSDIRQALTTIRPNHASNLSAVAQAGQRPPGGDERVLDGVLCIGLMTEDGQCGPVHGIHLQPDERLECGAIARAGLLDELSLHRPSVLAPWGFDARTMPAVHPIVDAPPPRSVAGLVRPRPPDARPQGPGAYPVSSTYASPATGVPLRVARTTCEPSQ